MKDIMVQIAEQLGITKPSTIVHEACENCIAVGWDDGRSIWFFPEKGLVEFYDDSDNPESRKIYNLTIALTEPVHGDEVIFAVGDPVAKYGGDYKFEGTVIAVMKKASGAVRVAVENADGQIHIFNQRQLLCVK